MEQLQAGTSVHNASLDSAKPKCLDSRSTLSFHLTYAMRRRRFGNGCVLESPSITMKQCERTKMEKQSMSPRRFRRCETRGEKSLDCQRSRVTSRYIREL